MSCKKMQWALIVSVSLAAAGSALADDAKQSSKGPLSFGALRPANPEEVRERALAWLNQAGKSDPTTRKSFDSLWAQTDRSVVDRLADTFALGDERAAKLLAEARDPSKAAPTQIPGLLADKKQSLFFRANLGLAYAKALSSRRVYEEGLAVLKSIKPEQVVDPVSYLFHRAVAEHALALKQDAGRSITRLLDDAVDVPERYKMISMLMNFDMQSWREKDLGWIARKMDNIERRLELSRGGPQTQKIQKEVVARLDELIKQIENQMKDNPNGGGCPNGGQQPGAQPGMNPTNPMKDSRIGGLSGPGNVDPKTLEKLAKGWGTLPEKERAKAMQDLTRDMPPKYRDVIESYFRKLAASESGK
jgi:hypothetical protein